MNRRPQPSRRRVLQAALCTALLPLLLDACSSSPNIAGVPRTLPEIALSGNTNTPPHHLSNYEYPFDANGNYVPNWAAEGERRAGRSAVATSSDESEWSRSHGGRSSGPSSGKSGGSSSKSEGKSKSSGGSRYVVKKGDTVERIAARLGVSVSRLKAANGMKTGQVRAGETLRVPR